MTFKNMIFETDEEGLMNIIKYWKNPEGRNTEYTDNELNEMTKLRLEEHAGMRMPHRIKVRAVDKISQSSYDELITQLMYNNIRLYTIKFSMPDTGIKKLTEFIFDKQNLRDGENISYLKHLSKDGMKDMEQSYNAKIIVRKRPKIEEVIELTGLLRTYI